MTVLSKLSPHSRDCGHHLVGKWLELLGVGSDLKRRNAFVTGLLYNNALHCYNRNKRLHQELLQASARHAEMMQGLPPKMRKPKFTHTWENLYPDSEKTPAQRKAWILRMECEAIRIAATARKEVEEAKAAKELAAQKKKLAAQKEKLAAQKKKVEGSPKPLSHQKSAGPSEQGQIGLRAQMMEAAIQRVSSSGSKPPRVTENIFTQHVSPGPKQGGTEEVQDLQAARLELSNILYQTGEVVAFLVQNSNLNGRKISKNTMGPVIAEIQYQSGENWFNFPIYLYLMRKLAATSIDAR